jgi:hypothetical protein
LPGGGASVVDFVFNEFVKSKFFPCLVGQISDTNPPSPRRQRGRCAIVTERWRGLRWTLWRQAGLVPPDEKRRSVRRSRVVLAPRPWRQADGAIRRRRWQKRPLTGESTKETVKPLRGESRDVLAVPVVQPVCIFVALFAHGTAGAVGARLSLRPLTSERDNELAKLRRNSRRENDNLCLVQGRPRPQSTANEKVRIIA